MFLVLCWYWNNLIKTWKVLCIFMSSEWQYHAITFITGNSIYICRSNLISLCSTISITKLVFEVTPFHFTIVYIFLFSWRFIFPSSSYSLLVSQFPLILDRVWHSIFSSSDQCRTVVSCLVLRNIFEILT